MKALRLIILLCFSWQCLFAQERNSIEVELFGTLQQIDYFHSMGDVEKMWATNDLFIERLKMYAESYPAMLSYPFDALKRERIDISTSDDALLRIYSWDTQTSEKIHLYESVIQYKSGAKTKAILDTPKNERDIRPDYHKIYTFTEDGKTYYLAIWRIIGSLKDATAGAHLFTLENGTLNDANIIKTTTGLKNELSYKYDLHSVVNIDVTERPDILYDPKTNSIVLPLVQANGAVTDKHITYKFNGQYFEK